MSQHSTTGTGPNKKLAKRAAAESLLQLLGYSRSALTGYLFIISSIQIYNVMFISASIQKLCLKLKVCPDCLLPQAQRPAQQVCHQDGTRGRQDVRQGEEGKWRFSFFLVRNSEARCWAYLAPLFIDISCLLYEVSKFCGEYISLFWRRRSVLSEVVSH